MSLEIASSLRTRAVIVKILHGNVWRCHVLTQEQFAKKFRQYQRRFLK